MMTAMACRASTFAHNFSGTTMPAELPVAKEFKFTESGGTMTSASMAVSTNALRVATPTGTAANGTYATGRCFLNPPSTAEHWVEIGGTNDTSGAAYPRSMGCCVGGTTTTFTNGVILWGTNVNAAGSFQIYSKIGGALVSRATVNSQVLGTNRIRLRASFNGTNWVYSGYKDDVFVLQWADTGNLITPGVNAGVAIQGIYSAGWFAGMPINFMSYGEN
jgi:hypothetical protein